MAAGSKVSARLSIPAADRKTIELIREITQKQHTDEDIYAVLKECSMDPDETAERLMVMDTFHEVRRKKDRKKEAVSSRVSNDSESGAVLQGRAGRAGRGGYDRKYRSVTKGPSVTANGPTSFPNGNSGQRQAVQVPGAGSTINPSEKVGSTRALYADALRSPPSSAPVPSFSSVIRVRPGMSASNSECGQTPASPASASGLNSASDPVLVPALKPQQPSAVGTIGAQHVPSEANHALTARNLGNSELKNAEMTCENDHPADIKTPEKVEALKLDHSTKQSQSLSLSLEAMTIDDGHSTMEQPVPSKDMTVDASSQMPPESSVSNGHHVTFPSNFQVPEAFRNGLTFGSFDVSFGVGINHPNGPSRDDSKPATSESSQEINETSEATSSRPSSSSNAHEGNPDYPDQLLPPEDKPEDLPAVEDNDQSAAIQKHDEPKQENPIPQPSTLQSDASVAFAPVPSINEGQLVGLDNNGIQPQDASSLSNYMVGNPSFMTSPSQTPPPSQQGVMQTTVAMPPPQLLPYFRQPYPPGYFPYGHYVPMVLPPMQQYLSPHGLPQQPAPGNLYLPPQAAAGLKYPVPQFKPGANVGNPAPVGIPSTYGSYGPSPVGYSLGPTGTTGNAAGNGDLTVSQLNENHGYTTTQLNEGSAAWLPRPGQDLAGLPVNSSYNLLPQSHSVTYSPSQPVAGPYAGIFQPAHTMSAPSMHPLIQQSQAMPGTIEGVRPQSGIYQQAQHAQMWNSNF